MAESIEEVIDSSRKGFNWKELVRYRELFYFFAWRDIKIKYKQTFLGFAWAVLQPLMMVFIFTFFFGRALNIPSQDLPYPLYVFSGLLMWNIFSSGLTAASNGMINNATIIKKIYFPRIIIPVSSILVTVFDFFMAFLIFIGLILYHQQPVSWTAIVYWPLAVILTIIATLGPACWLAALNVKYRDFRYVIPFLVQILFFMTPVIYPVTLLKYKLLQYILAVSPLYGAVELFRLPLTSVAPNVIYMSLSLASAMVFLVVGVMYFKRTEEYFADFV